MKILSELNKDLFFENLNKTGEALADAYWSIIPLGTPVRYRMSALDLHAATTELIEPTVSFKFNFVNLFIVDNFR